MFIRVLDYNNPTICHRMSYGQKQVPHAANVGKSNSVQKSLWSLVTSTNFKHIGPGAVVGLHRKGEIVGISLGLELIVFDQQDTAVILRFTGARQSQGLLVVDGMQQV